MKKIISNGNRFVSVEERNNIKQKLVKIFSEALEIMGYDVIDDDGRELIEKKFV